MTNKYSWDALASNLREDALNDGNSKKGYEEDSRFYKLARNDNDQGGALLRFIPDPDGVMFIKMTKINAGAGYNKRFCKDWSPQSIGLPDPFNEKFLEEWRAGNKEEAKRFGRSIRYLTNIKVIKDPANPDNEGKIFLYDMSQTIFEKVKNAAQPTPDEIALGAEPKDVYNPLAGNNFIMKVKRGTNNFITYEDSTFDEKVTAIYKSEEEADKDISENAYRLGEFYKPEFYKSYDELKQCLAWYLGEDSQPAQSAQQTQSAQPAQQTENTLKTVEAPKAETPKAETPKAETPKVQETTEANDDIDSLLDDILN